MDERDMLLVLTICELLGKPTKASAVEKAFENAKKELGRLGRPPREAQISNVRRHHENE
jgi:hypothetical protein